MSSNAFKDGLKEIVYWLAGCAFLTIFGIKTIIWVNENEFPWLISFIKEYGTWFILFLCFITFMYWYFIDRERKET